MTAYDLLDANILNLLQAGPQNPSVRALVLAKTGLSLPTQIKGFETAAKWLKSKRPAPGAVPVPEIFAAVVLHERKTGTCDFVAWFDGSGRIHLTKERVLEIADNSPDLACFRDEIDSAVRQQADENLETTFRGLPGSVNVKLEDFDTDDTIDSECTWDVDFVRAQALTIVKILRPELYAKWTGELPLSETGSEPEPELDPDEQPEESYVQTYEITPNRLCTNCAYFNRSASLMPCRACVNSFSDMEQAGKPFLWQPQ